MTEISWREAARLRAEAREGCLVPDGGVPRVVVGVDDCDGSRHALAWALGQACKSGAAVVAVHVVQLARSAAYASFVPGLLVVRNAVEEEISTSLSDEIAGEARRLGLSVSFEQRCGEPATELLAVVREQAADLLVVGASRPGWWSAIRFGSVGTRLARQHHVPVVVVP